MSPEPARPLDIPARVGQAVAAVLDKKGLELRVLHLEPVTEVTDYFLICSAGSQRQIEAIGVNYVICQFYFGDMAHDDAMRSLQLFADEVMPAFVEA